MSKKQPSNRSPVGPNSLEWLRQNVPAFKVAEAAASKVKADQDANREQFGK